jgi:hypothetical protein
MYLIFLLFKRDFSKLDNSKIINLENANDVFEGNSN